MVCLTMAGELVYAPRGGSDCRIVQETQVGGKYKVADSLLIEDCEPNCFRRLFHTTTFLL